jgi:gluconolactonase
MSLHAQNTGVENRSAKNQNQLIADGASLQLISDQFTFTEGPAADRRGNIFFTDQPDNKIWKYANDRTLSVFLNKAGRSNGMYFDKNGNLITCADEHNQLWSIQPNGKVKVLLKDFNGLHFNGPNDLWIHPNGGIYFTDPYYQRDYWERKSPEITGQKVYYFQKNKKPVVVADDLLKPNGIIGTPDGRYLYVADIEADKTYRYQIEADGSLSGRILFAPKGSDGMTIDDQGNIYLTGRGVTIYNSKGQLIEQIDLRGTSNVTFGGKGNNILFITAGKSIYRVAMKVHGAGW